MPHRFRIFSFRYIDVWQKTIPPKETWKLVLPQQRQLLKVLFEWHSPNVSTTPIMAMGCRQCLPLSIVQLKGKHCRKLRCRNGVVDTFKHVSVTSELQRVGVSSHYELMTVQWKRRRCPWLKPPSLWAQKVTTKGEEVSEKKRREVGHLLRTFKFKFLVHSGRKIKKNKPAVRSIHTHMNMVHAW